LFSSTWTLKTFKGIEPNYGQPTASLGQPFQSLESAAGQWLPNIMLHAPAVGSGQQLSHFRN